MGERACSRHPAIFNKAMIVRNKHTALPFLAFTLLVAGAGAPAFGQQLASASYSAPWLDDERAGETELQKQKQEEDIAPRHLTLADLESLNDDGLPRSQKNKVRKSSSALENMYSTRMSEDLELFGYDLFDGSQKPSGTIPSGMVADDYALSAGDSLEIAIRGQENERKTYTINSQGQLVTDQFNVITVTGKTLGDVRKILSDEAQALHNVDITLSLSGARQIDVLVIGDVEKPGRVTLTPFHTVLDALTEARGIKKTGSLRRIKLVRAGKSEFVDLYAMMMQGAGSNADKRLRDGDRLIVPPIGPTVAVSGAVKRPAIYEMKKGESLSTLEMLGLAGGVLSPGANRFLRLAVGSDGLEVVEDITEPTKRIFSDGGVLNVAQAKEKRSQNVELSGHTRDAGSHALDKAKTLSELIKNEQIFGDSLYPLIGVIERHDEKTLTKTLVEFSPRAALNKTGDMKLLEGDVVHLFSMAQIRMMNEKLSSETLLQNVSYGSEKDKEEPIKDAMIISFLQERSAFVRGAVRQAGAYPVSSDTTLESLVSVAGGATIEADTGNIEVTSRMIPADESADAEGVNRKTVSLEKAASSVIYIKAGDTVRVNQKFDRVQEQSVTLLGEVKNPGKYDLVPGDTLLSLIDRAGGLSDIAYPDGVIFSRASERKLEESRYKAQARDLELKLAEMMKTDDKDKKPDAAQVQTTQSLIAQLNDAKAIGRITVEADPDILTTDPEQNILLEAGDKIFIPRRPLTVRVGGEVLSPASLQFRKGKGASTYIDEAGGTTYYADLDRAFVTYPDGSAKPLSVSAWKQGTSMIPPGSTIIVPRDPKPYNFLDSAQTITTILANIALTGFYINDIGDDD